MSNPGQFNPTVWSANPRTPESAVWRGDSIALQKLADAMDAAAPYLNNAKLMSDYESCIGNNLDAAHSLPSAVLGQMQELSRKLGGLVGQAVNLRRNWLPELRSPDEVKALGSQVQFNLRQIAIGLDALVQNEKKILAEADNDVKAILQAAVLGSAPTRPLMGCGPEVCASIKADIVASLNVTGVKAIQKAFQSALDDSDINFLYVLLGPDCARLLDMNDIDRAGMISTYVDAQVKKAAVDPDSVEARMGQQYNPDMLSKIAGGRWAAQQQQPDKLSAAPGLAKAYVDAQIGLIRAISSSKLAEENDVSNNS